MNSLDTNVVLRYIVDDVPEQRGRARRLIEESACYLTDVVIIEVILVLETFYKTQRAEIVILLKKFLTLPTIVYNARQLDDTIDLYRANQSLSIVDCYSAIEAGASDNLLITFDKKLITKGGPHVVEP
jgi:predicted nucleic-acid-binding protein